MVQTESQNGPIWFNKQQKVMECSLRGPLISPKGAQEVAHPLAQQSKSSDVHEDWLPWLSMARLAYPETSDPRATARPPP